MKEKYSLDQGDAYEPSDSEEEYTPRERQLLQKVRKGQKKQDSDDEAVLGLEGEDDDEQSELEPFQSDQSGDEDDGLPDARAWGKKKHAYYGTAFVDPDYSSYNAQEEEVAEMELQEAKDIQKRLAKELDETDFSLDVMFQPKSSKSDPEAEVVTDLTDISKRQKLQLFKKDSPEFDGLVAELFRNIEDSKDVLLPFLKAVEKLSAEDLPIISFAKTLNDLLLNFGNNVVYYLILKAKRIPIKSHPVVKRLFQLRQLIEKLQGRYEEIVKPQILQFMEDLRGDNVEKIQTLKQAAPMLKMMKKLPKTKAVEEDLVEEPEDEEMEEEESIEPGKRKISYQIAKNKGLTPKRKSEQRNPRVRNRNRFTSATKRRAKTVQPVRRETTRYGGEATGIKAFVTRSTKFK